MNLLWVLMVMELYACPNVGNSTQGVPCTNLDQEWKVAAIYATIDACEVGYKDYSVDKGRLSVVSKHKCLPLRTPQ